MVDAAHVDRYGTPDGTLVIALHGAVANRKTWLPLARALSPELELWCPDLPGHGDLRDEPFRRATSLARVDALVRMALPRRVVLAGDSLGGYLAIEAAARSEHAIAGVVAGGCSWSMTGLGGALARASDLPVRAIETLAGTRRCEAWFAALVPLVARADDAAAIVRGGLRLRARSESLAELRGFDVAATLRTVRVPIAIVNGASDWPTRAGEGALLASAPLAERTIAPGVGHGVGFLAPSVFARAIDGVVRRALAI